MGFDMNTFTTCFCAATGRTKGEEGGSEREKEIELEKQRGGGDKERGREGVGESGNNGHRRMEAGKAKNGDSIRMIIIFG